MAIQWYPGHMNAARKKAAETMENTDLVIEVVDARLPAASCNPMVDELRLFRQRPCLKILNKTDLADPAATAAWVAYFNAQEGVTAYAMTTKKPGDVARIPDLAKSLAPHRGVPTKPLRIMIMGIPNVGKSTLMNALLKKRVAKVGDEPAVTKMQQKLYLDKNTILVDTPGMLWPKIAIPSDGLMLAASHAIGSNALIEEEVAVFLAEELLKRYPDLLAARYGTKVDEVDAIGVVEGIAAKRGFRIKGGDYDFEKASHTLLLDYRSGILGRISLETPDTRAVLLAQHAAEMAEKKRRKRQRLRPKRPGIRRAASAGHKLPLHQGKRRDMAVAAFFYAAAPSPNLKLVTASAPKKVLLVIHHVRRFLLGRTERHHQRQQMVFLRMGLARTGRLVPGQQLLQPLFWRQGHRLAQPGIELLRGDGGPAWPNWRRL